MIIVVVIGTTITTTTTTIGGGEMTMVAVVVAYREIEDLEMTNTTKEKINKNSNSRL